MILVVTPLVGVRRGWLNAAEVAGAMVLAATAPLPARLFLGISENDTLSMTATRKLPEAQLMAQPFPQLKGICRRFPKRDHYNVLPDAFFTGLQALLG